MASNFQFSKSTRVTRLQWNWSKRPWRCRSSYGTLPGAADNHFRCYQSTMTGMCLAKRSFTRGGMEDFQTRPSGWRKADAMYLMLVDQSTPASRFARYQQWVVINSSAMHISWPRLTNY